MGRLSAVASPASSRRLSAGGAGRRLSTAGSCRTPGRTPRAAPLGRSHDCLLAELAEAYGMLCKQVRPPPKSQVVSQALNTAHELSTTAPRPLACRPSCNNAIRRHGERSASSSHEADVVHGCWQVGFPALEGTDFSSACSTLADHGLLHQLPQQSPGRRAIRGMSRASCARPHAAPRPCVAPVTWGLCKREYSLYGMLLASLGRILCRCFSNLDKMPGPAVG